MADSSPPPFTGPALALPARLDQLVERWARLPWRLRALLVAILCGSLFMFHLSSVSNARGLADDLHEVWVASTTLAPGDSPDGKFVRAKVPDSALPELAIDHMPTTAPVLTIVAGTVATTAHFDGLEKAPDVPIGHRAIALTTTDADLYAPGSRVDLWQIREQTPQPFLEQLVVVSVKHNRVVLGIPEAHVGEAVQLQHLGQLQLAPAGPTPPGEPARANLERPSPQPTMSEQARLDAKPP